MSLNLLPVGAEVGFGKFPYATVIDAHHGRLREAIYKCRLPSGQLVYVKIATGSAAEELRHEAARLAWLRNKLPVPELMDDGVSDEGGRWLMLSEIEGKPSHLHGASPATRIDRLAEALRRVHSVSLQDCPFMNTFEDELAEARRRLASGEVDRVRFVANNDGMEPEQALEFLESHRGLIVKLVFTHGDFCLPNVILSGGKTEFSGVVDWAIAGAADPHRDFMAIQGSIHYNLGAEWIPAFYSAFGAEHVDDEKIRFYEVLDQFYSAENLVSGGR